MLGLSASSLPLGKATIMRKLLSKRIVLGVLACAFAFGLFATDASARFFVQGQRLPYFLYGADYFGNRSAFNGNFGYAKFYKFTYSGITLGVANGKVTNRSGAPQLYLNQGNIVVDPQNGFFYPSTGDLQRINSRHGYKRATTQLLLSYNPLFAGS